jgi:hypothetical protein
MSGDPRTTPECDRRHAGGETRRIARMFEIIGLFNVGELRTEKAVDQDIQGRA